jgi:Ribbon-helix-helix protein, copG family.
MGLRIVTFKLDSETLEQLDRYCRANMISRSEAIRKAIEILLTMKMNKKVNIKRVRIE